MAIQIADGFQLRVAKPLDDRQNVETIAQLDPTYGYEGQIVYVKDIKRFYTCYKDDNGSLAYKVMETGSSTPNESVGIELWVSGESYKENDFVSYNDYIYRCKITNNDADFVEDNWEKQSDTHVEITEQEILDLLGLTDEELETMAQLIDDSAISLNKTYSSSKIYADIRQCLEDSKTYTLKEIAKLNGSSYKVVTSTSEMTSESIIYLLASGNTYDMYIVEEDGTTTKIGDMNIDLSQYVKVTDLENDYLKKADADGKFATITTADGKIDKDKIVTILDDTVTDNQVVSAKATYDLANKKASKTHTHTTSDITDLSIPSKVSDLENDSNYLTSHQDISGLQTKTDNSLNTTNKTVVGAINEVMTSVDGKVNKNDINKIITTNIEEVGIKEYILANCTEGKVYDLISKPNCIDAPKSNTTFYIIVEKVGGYTHKVTAKELTGDNEYTCIYRSDINTWSDWKKVLITGDITTTISNSSTDTQVPSAKVVYDNAIKDKNLKTYTELSQLGISKGSETIEDIIVKLPKFSVLSSIVNNESNQSIYPKPNGMLIVNKQDNNRVSITFYSDGLSEQWIAYYRSDIGLKPWVKVSTTTVADVNETSIAFDETGLGLTIVNSHSSYKVINGICYVTIELNVVPPTDDKTYGYTKINTTRLPKIGFSTKAVLNVVEQSSSISAVLDRGDTYIKLHGNILGREGSCIIQGSFSYPVAE